MVWAYLLLAGFFEIGFVVGLKLSEGFTRTWPTLGLFVSGGLSFYLLSVAMRDLPAGTAYSVWTGIGSVGAVLLGILFFGDSVNPWRLGAVALIVVGVAALRLTEAS